MRGFHCDQCGVFAAEVLEDDHESWFRNQKRSRLPDSWIWLTNVGSEQHRQFCTLGCVAAWATEMVLREPV